jgi:DNA-binding MarR family transcriptional regulator
MGAHETVSSDEDFARHDAAAVFDALRRLVRLLRLASRAAEARTGISGAQLFVAQRLAEAPASSMAELAERTLTDPSSVSTVVARLVERGLVERTPSAEDRRRVQISLTEEGRAAVANAPELAQIRILNAVERMPPSRRRALARALEDLVREAGADTLEPRMFFEDEPEAPRSTPTREKGKRRGRA